MSSKKDLDRSHMVESSHNRKQESSDYDSLISPHNIYENNSKSQKQQQQQLQQNESLPTFSGYSNAETQTQTKTGDPPAFAGQQRTQTAQPNLAPWHYNPWWMLASTSRGSTEYHNGSGNGGLSIDIKIKQEEAQEQDELSVKNEVMDQLSIIPISNQMSKSPQTPSGDGICDDCSDPFCDSSGMVCRKLFHCPHCRKSYPTTLEFHTHLTGVHPTQKPFRCQICLEPFDKKSQLLRHLDSNHTRKDMNKCTVCSKYIKDKSNLRKHMQVHTGRVPQKQFKCDLCNNKRYMSLDRLNNHRIVCTGEKVLKYCEMCSKVFDNTRSLNSHKKVHAKELKCDLCGEQFRSLEHLNNHKLVCKYAARCCNQPDCDHDKAYISLPYGSDRAGVRALDATLSALKSQMN